MPDAERMQAGALRFGVRYRVDEYVALAIAHAVDTDAFVRAAPLWKRGMFAVVLAALASVLFVWKSARMGRCSFVIDAEGLRRTSKRGTSGVPWTRVQAVHVYRQGYLVELESGAVPVPFRVLSADARRRFEVFASSRLRTGAEDHSTPY